MSGLLRLEARRNMAHISRQTGVSEQNMQHFISQSPWSGRATIQAVQEAIAQRADWRGGVLIVDDSGDEKYGDAGAGVAHPYNGRHKQVERSQVGVFVAYAQGNTWSWVDGELFLSEKWFAADYAAKRQKAEVPAERRYQKKAELGWQMIQRARAAGIPFVAVTFDSLYGQDSWMRDQCQAASLEYYADVKGGMRVYWPDPSPAFVPDRQGHMPQQPQILSQWVYSPKEIAEDEGMVWQSVGTASRGAWPSESRLCTAAGVDGARGGTGGGGNLTATARWQAHQLHLDQCALQHTAGGDGTAQITALLCRTRH